MHANNESVTGGRLIPIKRLQQNFGCTMLDRLLNSEKR